MGRRKMREKVFLSSVFPSLPAPAVTPPCALLEDDLGRVSQSDLLSQRQQFDSPTSFPVSIILSLVKGTTLYRPLHTFPFHEIAILKNYSLQRVKVNYSARLGSYIENFDRFNLFVSYVYLAGFLITLSPNGPFASNSFSDLQSSYYKN